MLVLSQKVAMEIACASVSRVAQKKQQESQTFKKYPSGTYTREMGGGEDESPHVNSQNGIPWGKSVGQALGHDVVHSWAGGVQK